MNTLLSADTSHFISRQDSNDLRIGDLIKKLPDSDLTSLQSLLKNGGGQFCLLGYPDDEGISLNGGRVGAKEAPDVIRKPFYKMTPSFLQNPQKIIDLGNLNCTTPLAERHEAGKAVVKTVLENQHKAVVWGGGHDYGYADGAAFIEVTKETSDKKPVIINFDAHFDVRPTDRGLNSGTPFYRLLTSYRNEFSFFEIGMQPQCNSQKHYQWALDQGVHVLAWPEINPSATAQHIFDFILNKIPEGSSIFLSIDIDGFTSAEAPGCSQSWPQGFRANDFFSLLTALFAEFHCPLFSIYEVSPPLDQDLRTAKLAAALSHHFIYSFHRGA